MVRLIQGLKILPRWIILLIDLSILFGSVCIAYLLRFNFNFSEIISTEFQYGILIYTVAGLFSIFITQSYAGIIRYTGVQDGLRIVYSVSLGVALTLLLNGVNLWLVGRVLLPLSVLIISYFSSVIFLFAYRIIVKYIFRYYTKAVRKDIKNALIFGAGESGLVTNQIIEHDHHSQIRVSAFIEDNLRKVGKEINGLKIYDASKDLKFLIKKLNIHELIISVQDLSLERKNELVDICLQYGIKVRTTPPMSKWIKGELRLNQIKDINIEDLLGRESIRLDNIKVSSELRNKCILITGAAGSIGSELARQVLLYKPANVVLVDQSETSLHDFENELNHNGSVIKMHPFYIKPIVADICNYNRMNLIFKEYKPEIVFHAAAYKHVPMMETNASEAVSCNVMGTKNVVDISVNHQVKKFVMISTDKAVNPSSVMGASKRIAEIYVQSLNNHLNIQNSGNTRFITTRFGNVLGSNGSVIPLFRNQIAKGGPVTITHPDITRFFMTISEACQLVLEAGAMGKGGEVYIFDMGKSIKIVELAKKMIQLSGLQLGKDIEIKFIGLRKGEKLHEELFTHKENTIPTHHSKIMITKVKQEDFETVNRNIKELIAATNSSDEMELVSLMKNMVSEFKSNYSKFETLDQKQISIN